MRSIIKERIKKADKLENHYKKKATRITGIAFAIRRLRFG
jgi:hypothetical protein